MIISQERKMPKKMKKSWSYLIKYQSLNYYVWTKIKTKKNKTKNKTKNKMYSTSDMKIIAPLNQSLNPNIHSIKKKSLLLS